eukprot:TRINITY_DN4082_c0_g1_i1.p1 TRINITY_DN4082_c0_g1~~TRINITY_DN4082_c0_g1_i1.p1  ORF type:complete len:939 (+),score=209.35 TRINITY_DN4082_c0_g1_i1:92-2908(+)
MLGGGKVEFVAVTPGGSQLRVKKVPPGTKVGKVKLTLQPSLDALGEVGAAGWDLVDEGRVVGDDVRAAVLKGKEVRVVPRAAAPAPTPRGGNLNLNLNATLAPEQLRQVKTLPGAGQAHTVAHTAAAASSPSLISAAPPSLTGSHLALPPPQPQPKSPGTYPAKVPVKMYPQSPETRPAAPTTATPHELLAPPCRRGAEVKASTPPPPPPPGALSFRTPQDIRPAAAASLVPAATTGFRPATEAWGGVGAAERRATVTPMRARVASQSVDTQATQQPSPWRGAAEPLTPEGAGGWAARSGVGRRSPPPPQAPAGSTEPLHPPTPLRQAWAGQDSETLAAPVPATRPEAMQTSAPNSGDAPAPRGLLQIKVTFDPDWCAFTLPPATLVASVARMTGDVFPELQGIGCVLAARGRILPMDASLSAAGLHDGAVLQALTQSAPPRPVKNPRDPSNLVTLRIRSAVDGKEYRIPNLRRNGSMRKVRALLAEYTRIQPHDQVITTPAGTVVPDNESVEGSGLVAEGAVGVLTTSRGSADKEPADPPAAAWLATPPSQRERQQGVAHAEPVVVPSLEAAKAAASVVSARSASGSCRSASLEIRVEPCDTPPEPAAGFAPPNSPQSHNTLTQTAQLFRRPTTTSFPSDYAPLSVSATPFDVAQGSPLADAQSDPPSERGYRALQSAPNAACRGGSVASGTPSAAEAKPTWDAPMESAHAHSERHFEHIRQVDAYAPVERVQSVNAHAPVEHMQSVNAPAEGRALQPETSSALDPEALLAFQQQMAAEKRKRLERAQYQRRTSTVGHATQPPFAALVHDLPPPPTKRGDASKTRASDIQHRGYHQTSGAREAEVLPPLPVDPPPPLPVDPPSTHSAPSLKAKLDREIRGVGGGAGPAPMRPLSDETARRAQHLQSALNGGQPRGPHSRGNRTVAPGFRLGGQLRLM